MFLSVARRHVLRRITTWTYPIQSRDFVLNVFDTSTCRRQFKTTSASHSYDDEIRSDELWDISFFSKMLSPKSQKNVSEEDSSGSDAGSEVGPEPETDRFGFILTNGSTAGWALPHLCCILVLCFNSLIRNTFCTFKTSCSPGCWRDFHKLSNLLTKQDHISILRPSIWQPAF